MTRALGRGDDPRQDPDPGAGAAGRDRRVIRGPRGPRPDAVAAGPGPGRRAVPGSRRALGVLVAVVGAFGVWRAVRPAWQVPTPSWANRPEERMQDFRDALYFPIREFLAGGNPYDPAVMFGHWPVRQNFNLYQPYHLVLHLPFALPGYRVGAVAFAAFLVLLLVFLAVLAAGRVRAPLFTGTAVIGTLLVFSQVGKAQLYVGQVNPLIAVGAAGALLARDRYPRLAAAALALAWLKPQFGLPLAVLLFARGSRKVALCGTGLAALSSLVVVVPLVVGDGGVGAFLDVVARNLRHAGATAYGAVDSFTSQRVDVAAVFFRVTGWLPPGAELLALVGVLVVSVVLVRGLDLAGDGTSTAVADLLTCLAVVVAVVHQPGDVLIAVPALALVAVRWWRDRDPLLGVAVAALLVPFAHLHFVDGGVRSLLGERAAVTLDGVAVVVAWVALAVCARRRVAAGPGRWRVPAVRP
ncbi:glycosyltransferase 87 family protein [Actinosynnema sp. NPDC050436]|uniref:glycosyltransferase 87 family protein n=1 Tax=Actinosynnema sp. NPDC050436 TaxID=3155659 RepID=UPI0033EB9412